MKANNIYRETSFEKGMNDTLPPEHLGTGYLADALNCFIRSDEIVKRNGYTIIGDDLGSAACQGIKGVRFADGTKRVYSVFNGAVYSWSGSGSWTSLGGTLVTSGYVDIVVANNAVYFFDGTNTVVKVNSANTLSTVAAIPIGTTARWFHNMLFVTGVSGLPNRVRISNLGDPEDFSTGTTATIDVNPNDGDYVVGFGELKDELLIIKSQRAWSLTGFGTATLTLADLNERLTGFGTIARRSIINTGNDVLYLSFSGDVPHVRSIKRTQYSDTIVDGGIISKQIETTMKGLNKSALDMCAAVFDGRNAWFAIPNGSSTTNNKVIMYDTVTKAWVRHSGINASCWDVFAIGSQVQIYFGEATGDSKAYRFDTSTSDNGTAINFQFITRRFGGDMPESKKKWKYSYLTVKETGNYDLTVDFAKDGFDYSNLGTINLSGSGTVFDNIILDTSRLGSTDIKRKRFSLPKVVSFYTQYKVYETSATSSVTIRDFETMYFPKHVREV